MVDNIRAKAIELPAPVTQEEAIALKKNIEQSLVDMRKAQKWDEYLEMSDRVEIDVLKAKLEGTLNVINIFLQTGEWSAPASTGTDGAGTGTDGSLNGLADLQPGWNGNVDVYPDEQFALPPELVENAEYAGAVFIKDDGDPSKEVNIALQLDATATDLRAFNRGKDIIYVETYKADDGTLKKKYWVGKDHVTHVRASISITAHTLDHSVKIDASRVYRVSDGSGNIPYGQPAGLNIFGTDHYDDIIGSQGDDYIVGLKGNDTLSGMGGLDTLFGDDNPDFAASRAANLFGLRSDLQDGADTLDGGSGKDVIDGGGGLNTGFSSDAITGANAETVHNVYNHIESPQVTPTGWLGAETHGWVPTQTAPGEVELNETFDPAIDGARNVLSLNMPEGYDMASAEPTTDGAIKITFVKHVDGQPPQTFVIKINGALSPRNSSLKDPFTFKFSGNNADNIIDFHSVDFQNNLVEISGAGGDDMILAPKNILSADGLTLNALISTEHRATPSQINNAMNTQMVKSNGREPGSATYDVSAEANGNEILVKRKMQIPANNANGQPVTIDSKDYDKAYVMIDPAHSEDMLVILTKDTGSGTPQKMVIRIHDYKQFLPADQRNQLPPSDMSWLNIGPQASSTSPINTLPKVYLIHTANVAGNIIDGGTGNDFAFRSAQDTTLNTETGIAGQYGPSDGAERSSTDAAAEAAAAAAAAATAAAAAPGEDAADPDAAAPGSGTP